jgi:transposase
MPRTSPYEIVLTQVERTELESIGRKYTSPYCQVVRAKAVLLAAEGMENLAIGQRLDLPRQIVSKWRKRFFEQRLEGLESRSRTGRPPLFSPRRRGRGESHGV